MRNTKAKRLRRIAEHASVQLPAVRYNTLLTGQVILDTYCTKASYRSLKRFAKS